MKVAIFGGSFNPPHVAHQMAALWAISTGRADRVLWVPCFLHPFAKELAPFPDRLEMCRLAAAPLGAAVEVSRIEEEIGGESRTLRTIERLRADRRGDALALLVGSDLVDEMPRWMGWDRIRELAEVIVVGRQGAAPPDDALPLPAISSSEVRAALAAGRDVSTRVPAGVIDYIRGRGLYGARR